MNKSEKHFDVKKMKDETSKTAIKLRELKYKILLYFQCVACEVKVV